MFAAGQGDFDTRPLHPWVESVCLLDDIGDEGSADASGSFEEVETAIRGGADPLRVSDAICQSKRRYQFFVKLRNLLRGDRKRGPRCAW